MYEAPATVTVLQRCIRNYRCQCNITRIEYTSRDSLSIDSKRPRQNICASSLSGNQPGPFATLRSSLSLPQRPSSGR